MSWLKIFGHEKPLEVLCPYCDRPLSDGHDVEECSERGMSRRSFFFFGLMGASAAALAARLEGIPLPTARIQVIAKWRDLIHVKNATGQFKILYEGARRVLDPERIKQAPNHAHESYRLARENPGSPYWEPNGAIVGSPLDSRRLRVNAALEDLRILSVTDVETNRPLDYEIVRYDRADALIAQWKQEAGAQRKKEREARYAEERRKQNLRSNWGARAKEAQGLMPEPGYTRVYDTDESMFVDAPERAVQLSRLLKRHPRHGMLQDLWMYERYGGERPMPRLPA